MAIIYAQVWMTAAGARWSREFARPGYAQGNSRGEQRGGRQSDRKKIAERTRAAGIEQVVFDRGGYMYHGRVEAWPGGPGSGVKILRLMSKHILERNPGRPAKIQVNAKNLKDQVVPSSA